MLTLKIKFGNDAMQTADDAASALHKVATRITMGDTEGKVQDVNGNTVGDWSMELPEANEDADNDDDGDYYEADQDEDSGEDQ